MRKTLVFPVIFFILALIFAPLTRAVPLPTEVLVTTTPAITVIPTDVLQPTITPEITGETIIEPEPTGITDTVVEEGAEKKLDQKEIIGIILIGILIVIIVIQALWDKFRKPPTSGSGSSDPDANS